ncbi:hypothetical protein F4680DRAFT_413412 [Xylaria scruposa]|nr:hypothetical protein F4680DRAFT_413412 [Xylaria scruposa]
MERAGSFLTTSCGFASANYGGVSIMSLISLFGQILGYGIAKDSSDPSDWRRNSMVLYTLFVAATLHVSVPHPRDRFGLSRD